MSAQSQQVETVLTAEGYEALGAELAELTSRHRRRIAEELREARSLAGDLGDNVELLEARREQERVEARIAVLEGLLRSARVVEEADTPRGVAGVGSHVSVEDVSTGRRHSFRLVGSPEAAPTEGRISVDSPVGRALLGRRSGEQVDVETPGGGRSLRVRSIRTLRREPQPEPSV